MGPQLGAQATKRCDRSMFELCGPRKVRPETRARILPLHEAARSTTRNTARRAGDRGRGFGLAHFRTRARKRRPANGQAFDVRQVSGNARARDHASAREVATRGTRWNDAAGRAAHPSAARCGAGRAACRRAACRRACGRCAACCGAAHSGRTPGCGATASSAVPSATPIVETRGSATARLGR